MNIDYKEKIEKISDWIRETVNASGFKKVVIGLSGGIDSSLSAALSIKALGLENVFVLMMPSGAMSKSHLDDSKIIANFLDIPERNQIIIDIKESVNSFQKNQANSDRTQILPAGRQIELSESDDQIIRNSDTPAIRVTSESHPKNTSTLNKVRLGNIMARVRMIYLFDMAKAINALVVGTENKTENMLGYFTRFGDSASDLEPIASLYKTQVWEAAKILGIPEKIITKAPTAGLWENQTDEDELGFTYKEADQVLYYHFDEKLPVEKIVEKGIDRNVIEKVLETVKKNGFKQKTPYLFNG